jgi:hypothetical protein
MAIDCVLALLLLGRHDGQRVWKSFDWDAMDRLHNGPFQIDDCQAAGIMIGGQHDAAVGVESHIHWPAAELQQFLSLQPGIEDCAKRCVKACNDKVLAVRTIARDLAAFSCPFKKPNVWCGRCPASPRWKTASWSPTLGLHMVAEPAQANLA